MKKYRKKYRWRTLETRRGLSGRRSMLHKLLCNDLCNDFLLVVIWRKRRDLPVRFTSEYKLLISPLHYCSRCSLRKRRDSNSRWTFTHDSFQDCSLKPLGHSSAIDAHFFHLRRLSAGKNLFFQVSNAATRSVNSPIHPTTWKWICKYDSMEGIRH